MSIVCGPINVDDHFTIVPNAWVRDKRLSRKARGLLAELRSHRRGWVVTFESLVANGPEGIEAIRSAVRELEDCGYLERARIRGDRGRLQGMSYLLTDPPTDVAVSPTSGFPTLAEPTLDNPTPKKTSSLEDQNYQEDQKNTFPARAADDGFDAFWSAYPRKTGKGAARTAYRRACKKIPAAMLQAAAHRYAQQRAGEDPQFTPEASSWLNKERWDDPAPERHIPQPQMGRTTANVQAWLEMPNGSTNLDAIEGSWS